MLPYDEWNAELRNERVGFDWRPWLLVAVGAVVVAGAIWALRL